MDGITALVSYMYTTGYTLQLGAGRSNVSTDAVIRSQVCDFIMRYIEVLGGGSEPSPVADLIIMFLSIHYTELKGFKFDFCMTLCLIIRPAVSINDRHDNRAASSVRPQHISPVPVHIHHMSCTVLQSTAHLST